LYLLFIFLLILIILYIFSFYVYFQHIARKDESIEANMIQYSCADKYIDVIVADSALPFWRSDVEFDCILADRNIKFFKMIDDYQSK